METLNEAAKAEWKQRASVAGDLVKLANAHSLKRYKAWGGVQRSVMSRR